MNMFGLEGSGFIVAIAVTLLLAGAIVYYCNTRITAMEKAIVKQNQVLADFIGNVKMTLTNGNVSSLSQQQVSNASPENGATQEAVNAANDYYSNTTPEDKIAVSDDSASEDDSDSEDSDSSLESEDESEEQENDNLTMETVELNDAPEIDLGIIGITLTPPIGPPPPVSGPEISEILPEEIIEDKAGEIKTIKLGDVKNEEELDSVTHNSETLSSINSGSSDNSDSNQDDGETVNSQALSNVTVELVSKMKVADLRVLAVKLEVGNEDSVKKMKKSALQDMIKKKINQTEE